MPRVKRVSALDVARMSGVSQSAVSRAFSGASVSAATREKVMRAAEELGYRPNALLRVISRNSNLIGVVMGEITNPFYPEVLEDLLIELEARGFRVLLKRIDPAKSADEAVDEALTYRVRGVIATSSVISREMAERCAASHVPVVLFNRSVRHLPISSIACDNVAAGRQVADILLDSGHTRPALVSGNPAATTNRDRIKGFVDRIGERIDCGVPILGTEHSYLVGAEAAEALLGLAQLPNSVFCASDVLAFGLLDRLRTDGVRIPDDLSVIGFDDIPMSSWGAYNLSTMRQRRKRMVKQTVDTLLARIGGEDPGPVRLVPAEFIDRGTLKPR